MAARSSCAPPRAAARRGCGTARAAAHAAAATTPAAAARRWEPLDPQRMSVSAFRTTGLGRLCTKVLVSALETFRLAPSGSSRVASFLERAGGRPRCLRRRRRCLRARTPPLRASCTRRQLRAQLPGARPCSAPRVRRAGPPPRATPQATASPLAARQASSLRSTSSSFASPQRQAAPGPPPAQPPAAPSSTRSPPAPRSSRRPLRARLLHGTVPPAPGAPRPGGRHVPCRAAAPGLCERAEPCGAAGCAAAGPGTSDV
jgi:hypothetical protein